MKTNSRERMLQVLRGERPDRIPLDLGGMNNSTMHWKVEEKLCQVLRFPYKESNIVARDQQVVVPDERILRHFEADTRCLYIREALPWREEGGVFYDQWGIGRVFDGEYYSMREHPLEGMSPREALESYTWPDPQSEARILGLEELAQSYGGEYCLILEGFREASFGLPSWIRGITDFYMDLAGDPVFAHEFLDRVLEWNLEVMHFVMGRIGEYVDVFKFADDLGSQASLLISPEMYREFIKPRHARIVQEMKTYGVKVLFHSCGAVRPLIPDLIEIGVDALNPVQVSAEGMEPGGLKRDFGEKIVFWGGGIDTQESLPRFTPEKVRDEVRHNMKVLGRGGAYVFAQVHNITPDVPVENVVAMLEAYREFRDY